MEWQPIETAPRNGTEVLLALKESTHSILNWNSRRIFIGYFQAQGNDWIIDGRWATAHLTPSHWMPLPAAPK